MYNILFYLIFSYSLCMKIICILLVPLCRIIRRVEGFDGLKGGDFY